MAPTPTHVERIKGWIDVIVAILDRNRSENCFIMADISTHKTSHITTKRTNKGNNKPNESYATYPHTHEKQDMQFKPLQTCIAQSSSEHPTIKVRLNNKRSMQKCTVPLMWLLQEPMMAR
jgi:putative N-acetylmannosamine-6-phosphate epimerase